MPGLPEDSLQQLETTGAVVVEDVLAEADLLTLVRAVESLAMRVDLGVRGGVRDLFRILPESEAIACDPRVRALVEPVLGSACGAVRALLFDKTPGANWKVTWHQDVTIAVAQQRESPGFGAWSAKAGLLHVQPPAEVLERMLTVRLHLDACGAENGPVRILPGSHRSGKLEAHAVEAWRARVTEVACTGGRGSALVMRPLVLHASSAATMPAHRRVLHLEYASGPLPDGLRWMDWRSPATLPARAV